MADVVLANPTKAFFVGMITRDISLEDCVLDLLDNSIDGAWRQAHAKNKKGKTPLKGFETKIEINSQRCRVMDNCGGIPRDIAEKYAFRFGPDTTFSPDESSIGLYGVGMKRAIFKLGEKGVVQSRLGKTGFDVTVDVGDWQDRPEEWNFPIADSAVTRPIGTTVDISPLLAEVASVVSDPNFAGGLRKMIARDYAFLIQQGFSIKLNGRSVKAYEYLFRNGSGFAPQRTTDMIGGVKIEIMSGLAESPPDEVMAEDEKARKKDPSGWYIVCNDRVVIPADKSHKTVWGRDEFTRWHPQYRGFLGIVRLSAADPKLLPWTTTKRDIDETSNIYRIAVERMMIATERYTKYTTERRRDLDAARKAERTAKPTAALQVRPRLVPLFPAIRRRKKKGTNISYSVIQSELDQAKALLRNTGMSNKDVGLRTFKFFLDYHA